MDRKQTLVAVVVLFAGIHDRTAKAEQIREILSADDPTGEYVVEPGDPDMPIPDKDEDWPVRIVKVQGFQDTLNVAVTREAKLGPKPETTDES